MRYTVDTETGTIQQTLRKNLCILCGTCVAACPEGCITVGFDNSYKIRLDQSLCRECSRCLDACPGLNIHNYQKKAPGSLENYYLGEYLSVFSGYSTNFLRRVHGSSGGVATEILLYLLEKKLIEGAVVTRFSSGSVLRPEAFIAETADEITGARGSKYSPVPVNVLLREINFSKKYAWVGLPCHLQGLRLFLKQNTHLPAENILTLGLFCSRTNRIQATRELLRRQQINEDALAGIAYRGHGHPGCFTISTTDGGQKTVPHLSGAYWGLLFKKYFVQHRCWLCPDKTAFFSDISLGDDWSKPPAQDKVGTSVVLARTGAALEILQAMRSENRLFLEKIAPETVIRCQGLPEKMNIAKRARIARLCNKAVPEYRGYTFRTEKAPYRHELGMFLRIHLRSPFLLRHLITIDLLLYGCLQRLLPVASAARPGKLYKRLKKFAAKLLRAARRRFSTT